MVTMPNLITVSRMKASPKLNIPEAMNCPVKVAVQFLAGAWTLEIYWYLSQSSMRFGDLRRSLVTVSPKVLTQRLRDLEELGILKRTVLETYPPQVEYELTPLGRKFIPIIDLIADLGRELTKRPHKEKRRKKVDVL